jgi:hypothetical protein
VDLPLRLDDATRLIVSHRGQTMSLLKYGDFGASAAITAIGSDQVQGHCF